ncbi:hypothetical protein ABIE52_000124 [Rhodococcus sp. OAS809]
MPSPHPHLVIVGYSGQYQTKNLIRTGMGMYGSQVIVPKRPRQMIHADVNKVGKILEGGG